MVGGNPNQVHGSAVSGRRWFLVENDHPYAWHQGGGINEGVILLQLCEDTLAHMVAELTFEDHPEHVRSNGPAQDFLTRGRGGGESGGGGAQHQQRSLAEEGSQRTKEEKEEAG